MAVPDLMTSELFFLVNLVARFLIRRLFTMVPSPSVFPLSLPVSERVLWGGALGAPAEEHGPCKKQRPTAFLPPFWIIQARNDRAPQSNLRK